MTINSADFLSSCEQCMMPGNEVNFRNAISRAYYSMYHRAHESLEGIPACSRDHHSHLIMYMSGRLGAVQEPVSAGKLKVLAYELRQMRQARNSADYRIQGYTVTAEMAREAVSIANWFSRRMSE